eukprot:2474657-Rhodomonas_salina.1
MALYTPCLLVHERTRGDADDVGGGVARCCQGSLAVYRTEGESITQATSKEDITIRPGSYDRRGCQI